MFGYSKNYKNNEVQVVMGLLLDNNRIPVTYELFLGNRMDQSTWTKSVEKAKKMYKLDKITVIADRVLNSGKTLNWSLMVGMILLLAKKSSNNFKQLVWNDEYIKEYFVMCFISHFKTAKKLFMYQAL